MLRLIVISLVSGIVNSTPSSDRQDDVCEVDAGVAKTTPTLLQAASLPTRQEYDLLFLRIQKTGSETFGRYVMGDFCTSCDGTYHRDWNQVQVEKANKIVTLLRHPVERTISEFLFLHDNPSVLGDSQWDVMLEIKGAIWKAVVSRNMSQYFAIKQNPSLNRQTMYLAGFKAEKYHGQIPLHNGTNASLLVGIDWHRDGPEILEIAKQHLMSNELTFGLADDYECSLRIISRAYGWPVDEVIARSQTKHHEQDKNALADELIGHGGKHLELLMELRESGSIQKWADVIDQTLKQEIEDANAMDMELYKFAAEVFASRRKGIC